MKYLKKFANHNDYSSFVQSGEMEYPNTSWCVLQSECHYTDVEMQSETITDAFLNRNTANNIPLMKNYAKIKSIRGNTMHWYQMWYFGRTVNLNAPENITNWQYSTSSLAENITSSGHVNDSVIISIGNILTVGHTYYAYASLSFPNDDLSRIYIGLGCGSSKGWYRGTYKNVYPNENNEFNTSFIYTAGKNTEYDFNVAILYLNNTAYQWIPSGGCDFIVNDIQLIDLTRLYGLGNEPNTVDEFTSQFPLNQYDRISKRINNTMTYFVSKDNNNQVMQMNMFNVSKLTGKLNGSGDSVVIFPDGMKSSCNEAVNDTYDEIKKVNDVWVAYKRIGTEVSANETSGRNEYEILSQEEMYVLDNQDINDEIYVINGGKECILPENATTPSTSMPVLEIEYKVETTV